jgi:hypothetical protein
VLSGSQRGERERMVSSDGSRDRDGIDRFVAENVTEIGRTGDAWVSSRDVVEDVRP